MTRGNNRRRLFSYPRDYLRFLRLAVKAHVANRCHINALALMSNHIHLMHTPPSVDASSASVKAFSQRYAQIRNGQRGSTGKLFEQRFYSKPIRNDAQLGVTVCYIDANPVIGGVVEEAIDYPYSTYAIHAGEPEKCALPLSAWTPSPWYLALGRSPTTRETTYRELFDLYVATKRYPDHQPEFAAIEELSFSPYRRRLLRPDGSRASEFVRFAGEALWFRDVETPDSDP